MKVLVDADCLYDTVLAVAKENQELALVLPLVQNQEACVYGAVLSRQKGYWAPGSYPYDSLAALWEQMQHWPMGYLLKDDRTKAMLQVIKRLAGSAENDLCYLEVTAPFSVLTSLVPPMKVYGAMRKKSHPVLEQILNWLSRDLAHYIKEAVVCGCSVISLADPTGSMNLLGERTYNQWVAPWEVRFLGMCESVLLHVEEKSEGFHVSAEDALHGAVIHLCGKMSSDLVNQGWMEAHSDSCSCSDSKEQSTGTYLKRLSQAAGNGTVHYAGLGCIRNGDSRAGIISLAIIKRT